MLWTAPAGAVDAGEKAACVAAADQGQQLRDENKFRVAREAFARCARDTCPALVRQDCAQWSSDLEQNVPTVILRARDGNGNDLLDVAASLDGQPFATRLDGKALPADPGEHVFAFQRGGFGAIEQHVVLSAAEKARVIEVQFQGPPNGAPPTTRARSDEAAPAKDAPIEPDRGPPLATWVLGGVAAAAFASEAYFGISGLNARNADLGAGGCAPHCSAAEKSSIQTTLAISDTSLGVGVLSAGLAAYFFLSSKGSTVPAATAIDVVPRAGGAVATFGCRF